MFWTTWPLIEWDIVGMNHYYSHEGTLRHLFVVMTYKGRCIRAAGSNECAVVEELERQARAVLEAETLNAPCGVQGAPVAIFHGVSLTR